MKDPATCIIAASILCFCIGFMACGLFASKRIRDERRSWWREGYGACNRDHERRRH